MGCGWGTQGIDRRGSLGWRMCEVGGQGDWITLTRHAREHPDTASLTVERSAPTFAGAD